MTIDQRELRNALGNFATGITVVTALSAEGEKIGVTINSFASVSLAPPLVLFSLKSESPLAAIFNEAESFTVNILKEDQVNLSNLFAGPGENKFDTIDWHEGKNGVPVLDGTIATMECKRTINYPGGDHTIYLGEVTELSYEGEGNPLLYFRGGYKTL